MGTTAVFLDRDGTINVNKDYMYKIEDFEYIPGSLEAVKRLTDHGIRVFVVTNQSGVARGLFTEDQLRTLSAWMVADMARAGARIAEVLYCPHHPEGVVPAYRRVCDCRKPGTGMLTRVIEREGLRPSELALVGDSNSDIEAGRALGLKTFLVRTGYGASEAAATRADAVVDDLAAAADRILAA